MELRDSIHSIAYNDRYGLLAIGLKESRIKIFNLALQEYTDELSHHGAVTALAFNKGGYHLFSAASAPTDRLDSQNQIEEYHSLIVWDIHPVESYGGNSGYLIAEKFRFLNSYLPREVHPLLINASIQFNVHSGRINCLECTYNESQTLVASASDDHTIKLWNYAQKYSHSVQTLRLHQNPVKAMSFSSDSEILIGASERRLGIWKVMKTSVVLKDSSDQSKYFAFLIFQYEFDVESPLKCLTCFPNWYSVEPDASRNYQMLCGLENELHVYSLDINPSKKSNKPWFTFFPPSDYDVSFQITFNKINDIAFPGITTLSSRHSPVDFDVLPRLFRNKLTEETANDSDNEEDIDMQESRKIILCASGDKNGKVILWAFTENHKVTSMEFSTLQHHEALVTSAEFISARNSDEEYLATGSLDESVILWDVDEFKVSRHLERQPSAFTQEPLDELETVYHSLRHQLIYLGKKLGLERIPTDEELARFTEADLFEEFAPTPIFEQEQANIIQYVPVVVDRFAELDDELN